MTGMRNQPAAAFGHVSGLDGVRLFAVAIVVVSHYRIVPMMPGGFGVSIFFFLSGFLISRLLLAEEKRWGRINLRNFYIRRLIRLLPPLLLMGTVAVPALYLVDPADFSAVQIVLSFAYLGNIVKFGAPMLGWSEGYRAIEPLWSLAVEEHFYLLLPPALILLKSPAARIRLMLLAVAGPLILRMLVGALWPVHADQINYHFTFTRLDAMAWGVLLTLLLDSGRIHTGLLDRRGHAILMLGGFLCLASMVHWTRYYEEVVKYTPQSLAIGIAFAALVLSRQTAPLRAMLEWRPVAHLGRISYEIYLWHYPVLTVVQHFAGDGASAIFASIIATLVISHLSYEISTKRLTGLRRKFGAHPSQPSHPQPLLAGS